MLRPFPRNQQRTTRLEASYIAQRIGMAALAAALPIALIASTLVRKMGLKASISHYYLENDTERNIFVGALVSIGIFLILYKGYNWVEDRILDLAGISALGIAFFPTQATAASSGIQLSMHGTFAAIFFACIAYICIFMSEHSLEEFPDERDPKPFRRAYRLITCMMIFALVVLIPTAVFQHLLPENIQRIITDNSLLFWGEALAIWSFAAFWYTKTRELDNTCSWIPFSKKAAP